MIRRTLFVMLFWGASSLSGSASEKFFTYTYEPETMPQGAMEFEQWTTLRSMRDDAVGQRNYSRFDLREEFEYGASDNLSLSLYLNTVAEHFVDPMSHVTESHFEFDGVSIEGRYMVLNPAEHRVGLTLYVEPRYSGAELELEEKLILGQRLGDWKWAANVSHATEWDLDAHSSQGELEFTFGMSHPVNDRWSAGIEARNHNEMPGYDRWSSSAIFAGPCITYTQDKWWATVTVLPQLFGKNRGVDTDGSPNLVLDDLERLNVRLIFGIEL